MRLKEENKIIPEKYGPRTVSDTSTAIADRGNTEAIHQHDEDNAAVLGSIAVAVT